LVLDRLDHEAVFPVFGCGDPSEAGPLGTDRVGYSKHRRESVGIPRFNDFLRDFQDGYPKPELVYAGLTGDLGGLFDGQGLLEDLDVRDALDDFP